MPKKRSATQRGYGVQHQRTRARLIARAYGQLCGLCGQVMEPGQDLDLDHTPDRTGYRGMAHASCNRSDGARRGNAMRAKRPPLRPERDW